MIRISEKQRIVIKLGTSTIAHGTGKLNIRRMTTLVRVLADLQNSGKEIIIVSSGAVGLGVGKLGLKKKPTDTPSKQAAAAVGQCELMYTYDKLFSEYNHTVAQILVTGDDIDHSDRKVNFINTMRRLLELGALPIINENDSVSTNEIEIGDNDTLGAIVATAVNADLLIILSDIDGLYTADPKKDSNARLLHTVSEITPEIEGMIGGAGSKLGTGGMITKIHAAEIAMGAGIDMAILNGRNPSVLYDLFDGKDVGTIFTSK